MQKTYLSVISFKLNTTSAESLYTTAPIRVSDVTLQQKSDVISTALAGYCLMTPHALVDDRAEPLPHQVEVVASDAAGRVQHEDEVGRLAADCKK